MPKKFAWYPKNEMLSYEKITRLSRIFVGMGIEKIRLTGGEPLVRPQIEKLIHALSNVKGIKALGLTTNGLLLGDKVPLLKQAGLRSVNISLDTLVEKKFKTITGVEGLSKVQRSLRVARDAGFEVKINTVIIRGQNDDELGAFAEFAIAEGVSVRFIEFMPLDGAHVWNPTLVVSKAEMMQKLGQIGIKLGAVNNDASDPARLYTFGNANNTLGFIPSVSEPFCSTCDRVRLTSQGKFLTCLFEQTPWDIKGLLRSGRSDKEIAEFLIACYAKKFQGRGSIMRGKNLLSGAKLMNTIGG